MRNAVSGMRRRVKKAVWQDGGSLRMPAHGQLRARLDTKILSDWPARLCYVRRGLLTPNPYGIKSACMSLRHDRTCDEH